MGSEAELEWKSPFKRAMVSWLRPGYDRTTNRRGAAKQLLEYTRHGSRDQSSRKMKVGPHVLRIKGSFNELRIRAVRENGHDP